MRNKNISKDIGVRIKEIRIKKNLSQANFAKSLNIEQRVLSYYEKGKRTIPYSVIIDLRKKYSVSLLWLILGKKGNDVSSK